MQRDLQKGAEQSPAFRTEQLTVVWKNYRLGCSSSEKEIEVVRDLNLNDSTVCYCYKKPNRSITCKSKKVALPLSSVPGKASLGSTVLCPVLLTMLQETRRQIGKQKKKFRSGNTIYKRLKELGLFSQEKKGLRAGFVKSSDTEECYKENGDKTSPWPQGTGQEVTVLY